MMRKGIPVSPGVAIGTAYCIHEVYVDPDKPNLNPGEVAGEIARFEAARKESIQEIRSLQNKVERQVGKDAAAVFAVHESILNDPIFVGKVKQWIQNEHLPAQAALAQMLEHYGRLLDRSHDDFLKDRLGDIRDIVMRLTSHLSEALDEDTGVLPGPLIVVADELLPSQVVMLGDRPVHGIVTQAGSQTSHAAIIARSRGIPAVSGIPGILRSTKTGDVIVVDGRDGHILINPDPESLAAYRKLEREFFNLRDQLAHNRDQPAKTADGVELELLANINGVADAKTAIAMGASGVGLYRTEYLYLTHPDVPDEDEQIDVYRQVIEASPNHRATIRTLDIGGDKTIPFLGRHQHEMNPFMGWRSIRLSFEHPEFFMTQIRAILRAAAVKTSPKCDVQILFPMVTNLEELRKLRTMVTRAQTQLRKERKAFGKVDFGMMVEVPAAAVMMDRLLGAVDYVSIGSNDLVQYLMAADRDNPKVSHLCQPLSPAVLRVLESVIRICRVANRPVTLCGEMAGQPAAFTLLLGMGLRRFSMSPAFIPSIKELASHLTIERSQAILKKALKETTTKKINRLLNEQLLAIAPNLEPLLTKQ
jgi:phosphoenolpyruvate-protein phosphotransferase (PTS system enzyme I)